MGMKNLKAWLIIVLFTLIPVALWLIFIPAGTGFGSRLEIVDTLARLAAIVGLSLISISIILSARFKLTDGLFHGLDKSYRAHHIIGCLALIALLLHSALITLKYSLVSLPVGFDFLINIKDIPLLFGKVALVTMIASMIVALYIFVRYQWFILTMRILGAVVFLGGYHALFVSGSDLRTITPLYIYMLLLGGAASLIYIWRSIFHRSLHKTYQYQVVSVEPRGEVTDIHLSPMGATLQHYAGQFAFLKFYDHVKKEQHPFTISSGSSEQNLRFCIKKLGDFTQTLPELKAGDKVSVEGPFGQFSFTKMPYTKQVWIAGGIGITPFLSMAHSLPRSGYNIELFWSVTNKNEAVFADELYELQSQLPGLKVNIIATDSQGYLTADKVAQVSGTGKTDILLCGPPPMMKSLSAQFKKLGVTSDHIHYEEFSL